jgi:hypothetical protein
MDLTGLLVIIKWKNGSLKKRLEDLKILRFHYGGYGVCWKHAQKAFMVAVMFVSIWVSEKEDTLMVEDYWLETEQSYTL